MYQLPLLPREEICAASLEANGKLILVSSLFEALEISNALAPEHLELSVAEPFALLPLVKHAGSIFLGYHTPEALGDYFAGTNHTLPTSGTARFSSPLSVDDFIKKSSFCYYSSSAAAAAAEKVNLYAAGVCGWSKACVTSYFNGTIESPLPDWEVCYFDTVDPPDMVNEAVMREIAYRLLCDDYGVTLNREKLMAVSPEEMRSYAKENAGTAQKRTGWEHWFAFYCPKTNIASQDFLTYAVDEAVPELVYVLDPELKGKERSALSEILSRVFTGDEFYRICQENGVKYGAYDNYDLRREPDCAFEGFDFGSIWIMGEDGLPELRLFAGSKEDGVTTYENPLAGVVR